MRAFPSGLALLGLGLLGLGQLVSCGEPSKARSSAKVEGNAKASNATRASEDGPGDADALDDLSGNYADIANAVRDDQPQSMTPDNNQAPTASTDPNRGDQPGKGAPQATPNPNNQTPPTNDAPMTPAPSSVSLLAKFSSSHPPTAEATCQAGMGEDPVAPQGLTPTISNEADNILQGDLGDNAISGGNGNDQIFGLEGNDVLQGNQGNDLIEGQFGNDFIFGGGGQDDLRGGDGADRIVGDGGSDAIDGGNGDDQLHGREDADRIIGGEGNDRIDGGSGEDELQGNGGSDFLAGNDDNDTVRGGSGDDCVNGGNGNDLVIGGGGSDLIRGGPGNDILHPFDESSGGTCEDDSFASCDQDWLFGDPAEGSGGGNDLYVIGDKAGRVVIAPDPVGDNVVDCDQMSTKPSKHQERNDLFLLSGTTLVRIVDFAKPGATRLFFTDSCR